MRTWKMRSLENEKSGERKNYDWLTQSGFVLVEGVNPLSRKYEFTIKLSGLIEILNGGQYLLLE